MALHFTDSLRQELHVYVERLLFALKRDGVTAENAAADLLGMIEAAARDDHEEVNARLRKARERAWDD